MNSCESNEVNISTDPLILILLSDAPLDSRDLLLHRIDDLLKTLVLELLCKQNILQLLL